MVSVAGLEPATLGSQGRYSAHLSYTLKRTTNARCRESAYSAKKKATTQGCAIGTLRTHAHSAAAVAVFWKTEAASSTRREPAARSPVAEERGSARGWELKQPRNRLKRTLFYLRGYARNRLWLPYGTTKEVTKMDTRASQRASLVGVRACTAADSPIAATVTGPQHLR